MRSCYDLNTIKVLSNDEMLRFRGGDNPCKMHCMNGCSSGCQSSCRDGDKGGVIILPPVDISGKK